MPLCHWPCSCYPNHALGQVNDWMNEIYPRWVAAHGVMIVTPVYWYQAPSVLKLMIDRLVCADGGNPDPTTTSGKDPAQGEGARARRLAATRGISRDARFAVVVHGDTVGAETLRRSLWDWLQDMQLVPAALRGDDGSLHRLLRTLRHEPCGSRSDRAIQREVRDAALALVEAVRDYRAGKLPAEGERDEGPRPK